MPHFGYIIQSLKDASYYIGSCENPPLRLQRHNDGWTRSTKSKRPWKLVFTKEFPSKSEALKWERHAKRMKSRAYIVRLIAKQSR